MTQPNNQETTGQKAARMLRDFLETVDLRGTELDDGKAHHFTEFGKQYGALFLYYKDGSFTIGYLVNHWPTTQASENMAVRLEAGGDLEGIATKNAEDETKTLELICAYVRGKEEPSVFTAFEGIENYSEIEIDATYVPQGAARGNPSFAPKPGDAIAMVSVKLEDFNNDPLVGKVLEAFVNYQAEHPILPRSLYANPSGFKNPHLQEGIQGTANHYTTVPTLPFDYLMPKKSVGSS